MKLSFVIPAYNEEHYLADCLDAIVAEKKASPHAADIEIIVVNNASTDGTEAVARRYQDVIVVNEQSKGIVHARRAGYTASTGDIVANVDADTRITPGWIEKVFRAFERDERLVALSGPFIYYDAPVSIQVITIFFYGVGYVFYVINRFILRVGSMLQGGNFVVRRSALEKIGGYDESLSFYGEDSDVARRLSKVGKVRFVFHLPARSSSRRMAKEGGLSIGLRYALNYFWIMYFKKPFTKDYIDIRFVDKGKKNYKPEHRVREFVIASCAILIFVVIVGGGAYAAYSVAATGTVNTISLVRWEFEAKVAAQKAAVQIRTRFTRHSTSTITTVPQPGMGN
ncbi:MAG: glycosyltransferase family 2 protein [Candidatus Pacebacteria bacterium]|nr:glycosyltransferase family 2 protein [Candidatus Paceibacterota bacterium]